MKSIKEHYRIGNGPFSSTTTGKGHLTDVARVTMLSGQHILLPLFTPVAYFYCNTAVI
jgi:DUF1365 family protein